MVLLAQIVESYHCVISKEPVMERVATFAISLLPWNSSNHIVTCMTAASTQPPQPSANIFFLKLR